MADGAKGWVEEMIDYYSQGMTDVEVCKELKITRKQFNEYLQDPNFAELVETGRDYAEAFWVSLPRKNLHDKTFMVDAWKFYMANRYAWGTKTERKETSEHNLEKIKEQLRAALPELGRTLNIIDMGTVRKGITKQNG